MTDNRKYLLFLSIFLLFTNHVALARTHNKNIDNIEVFMKGKKYDSFYAYKREKLMKSLREILPSSTEEYVNRLVESLLSKHSPQQIDQLTSEEIETAVKETQEENKEGSMNQMTEMLQDYFKEHKEIGSIRINPNKVKTIILGPTP